MCHCAFQFITKIFSWVKVSVLGSVSLTIASENDCHVLLAKSVNGEQHSRTVGRDEAKCHVVSGLAIG